MLFGIKCNINLAEFFMMEFKWIIKNKLMGYRSLKHTMIIFRGYWLSEEINWKKFAHKKYKMQNSIKNFMSKKCKTNIFQLVAVEMKKREKQKNNIKNHVLMLNTIAIYETHRKFIFFACTHKKQSSFQ